MQGKSPGCACNMAMNVARPWSINVCDDMRCSGLFGCAGRAEWTRIFYGCACSVIRGWVDLNWNEWE